MLTVSLIQIADRFNIIPQTLWNFLIINQIPLVRRKPSVLLDLDSDQHPFLISTRNAIQYNHPFIFYTISDLATLLNLDPKTVKKNLIEFDIPIYNQENKGIVYLTDFLNFNQKIRKNNLINRKPRGKK